MGEGWKYPSMTPAKLKGLLHKLGYRTESGGTTGSHEWLSCSTRPRLRWAFHASKRELSHIEVRNVLLKQVKLSPEEAKNLVQGR